jgi:DNA polymerase-1
VLDARPKLRAWMAKTIIEAHAQGYVEAVSGRRNYLMQINSGDDEAKRDAERKAINMPIQSWTSDLLLWSALRIMRRVQDAGLEGSIKIWNLVHDNIVWEMPEGLWARFLREIALPEMTTFATNLAGFPFLADAKVGRTWGTMSKVCLKCWGLYDSKKCPACELQAVGKAG